MKKFPLHWQILAALILAAICGLLFRDASLFGIKATAIYDFFGQIFLNALKMIVVPLVVSSVVIGVAGIGSTHHFGRLGFKTISYYLLTTLIAVLTGLCFVNLLNPGERAEGTPLPAEAAETQKKLESVEGRGFGDLVEIVQRMVPANLFRSALEGDMLGLITFSLLFGYFTSRLPQGTARDSLTGFFKGINDVMLLITDLVMRFAPLGVFALVAKVIATTGVDAFRQTAWFFLTVLLGLGTHFFLVLPLLVRFIGRVNPVRHFRAMSPALLTAFSTASSSATLPLTMDCVEKRAGVSNRIASFTLPLGATVNMDGTALYECVAAMFIAQMYGVELGFAAQFTVVLLALLTSIGVAGIPAASLVAIVIILNAVGLPAGGIGMILAVDRLLDMCRTTVNVFSDTCGAVIIARSEGETGVLQSLRRLER